MNGNSACSLSQGASYGDDKATATMPLWFRLGLPVPQMLVSGA